MSTQELLVVQLARLICYGQPFSTNEITDCGNVNFDPDHTANAKQNTVGAFINATHRKGMIRPVGHCTSCAPNRKGGEIRTWVGTPRGVEWARRIVATADHNNN